MEAKDKASRLIDSFRTTIDTYSSKNYDPSNDTELTEIAKACADICVNEILRVDPINPWAGKNGIEFWKEVKKEIRKYE